MVFRELIQSDIDFMKDKSISRGIFSKMPEQIDWNYTLEHEGKILGVGGLSLINATTGWVWLDLSIFAKDHITNVYRTIREWMTILCKDKGIKRLMAYCEIDFEKAVRTLVHLGFHCESTMPNFVDDKPADLYVKFMEN